MEKKAGAAKGKRAIGLGMVRRKQDRIWDVKVLSTKSQKILTQDPHQSSGYGGNTRWGLEKVETMWYDMNRNVALSLVGQTYSKNLAIHIQKMWINTLLMVRYKKFCMGA